MFTACKDDDDDPIEPCNYTTELQAETTALNNAAVAYGQDPSQANCISYRNALQAYVNAAGQYEACAIAAGQGAAFQQSLDSAQAFIDGLSC